MIPKFPCLKVPTSIHVRCLRIPVAAYVGQPTIMIGQVSHLIGRNIIDNNNQSISNILTESLRMLITWCKEAWDFKCGSSIEFTKQVLPQALDFTDDHLAPGVELKLGSSRASTDSCLPRPTAHSPLQPQIWDCCDTTRDVVCWGCSTKISY